MKQISLATHIALGTSLSNTEIGSLVDPTYDANLEYNQLSRYKHSEIRHASEPGESKHKNTRKPKPRKKHKKTHRKK